MRIFGEQKISWFFFFFLLGIQALWGMELQETEAQND